MKSEQSEKDDEHAEDERRKAELGVWLMVIGLLVVGVTLALYRFG